MIFPLRWPWSRKRQAPSPPEPPMTPERAAVLQARYALKRRIWAEMNEHPIPEPNPDRIRV